VLYLTAGPDGRMWFNEFNRSALAAITTNAPLTGGPSPTTTSPGPTPAGQTPSSSSPGPAYAARPSPAACSADKLILTDVYPDGGRTRILGVAPAAAAGKQIAIVSAWNGKAVAKVKVASALSFGAAVALPPRALRFTNRVQYFAELGHTRTGIL
jgi:hypothetical protein